MHKHIHSIPIPRQANSASLPLSKSGKYHWSGTDFSGALGTIRQGICILVIT